jgi:hypothetical protein
MTVEKIAIIHTGFHKTGSSSVQHSLAHNRPLLKKHGYHYPDISLNGIRFYNCSLPLYGRYCDHPERFLHYWYHNKLDADFANKEINNLFEKKLWGQNKLIFSDEFISTLSAAGQIRLRDDFKSHGYKVRVISYIREPFNLIVSAVQQFALYQSIQKTIASNRVSQDVEKIQTLIDVFQSDAEFYNFEKACQHAAGPVGFFFDLLGINLPAEKALRVNEGMSDQAVRLLSFINDAAPQFVGKAIINPIRKRLDVVPLLKIKGDKFQFTSAELEVIKLRVLEARSSIAVKLGDAFLPPVNFSCHDPNNWDSCQLEYLLKIRDSLDLHLLLRVHDFLFELDLKSEAACAQRDQFSMRIRERLDKEHRSRTPLPEAPHWAKRWCVYKLIKRLHSLLISAH